MAATLSASAPPCGAVRPCPSSCTPPLLSSGSPCLRLLAPHPVLSSPPRPSRSSRFPLVRARATVTSSSSSPSAASPSSVAPHPALPRLLTIAGSDSGAGAGIQADLKAAAARGVWCSTVVSALTAQNSQGVQGVLPTPPDFVRLQIESILSDIGADAIKTGMLPNGDVIEAVCDTLRRLAPSVPLVVDPVLVATSGDSLSSSSALDALRLSLCATVEPSCPWLQ